MYPHYKTQFFMKSKRQLNNKQFTKRLFLQLYNYFHDYLLDKEKYLFFIKCIISMMY